MGSASFAGLMIPGVSRAAQPCPPPQISLSGGTTATTNCTIVSGSTYSTNFSLTEDPLSEGGKWINGKAVGLDWNNVRSASGRAFASDFTGVPSRYSDPIAHLNTAFTPNQFAQGTVARAPGYSPPDGHEVELLLRFQITARNARGYEVLWAHTGQIAIVRWNGPVGDYTPLPGVDGIQIGAPVEGDVLRAEIVGSVIRVYKNGSLVVTAPSDTTWTSGQPGIGFWPLAGATLASFGWKTFSAGSL